MSALYEPISSTFKRWGLPRSACDCIDFGDEEAIKKLTLAYGDSISPIERIHVGLLGTPCNQTTEFTFDFYNLSTHDLVTDSEIADEVSHRYGTTAFGFRRCVYMDGRKTFLDKGWIFLSGKIKTAEEVFKDDRPDWEILRQNLRNNDIPAVIIIGKRILPFRKDDDVVNEIDDDD